MAIEWEFVLKKCTDLTKPGVGRVVIHSVRLFGWVLGAWFFVEVDGRTVRYDVSKDLLRPLMRCESKWEALRVLGV